MQYANRGLSKLNCVVVRCNGKYEKRVLVRGLNDDVFMQVRELLDGIDCAPTRAENNLIVFAGPSKLFNPVATRLCRGVKKIYGDACVLLLDPTSGLYRDCNDVDIDYANGIIQIFPETRAARPLALDKKHAAPPGAVSKTSAFKEIFESTTTVQVLQISTTECSSKNTDTRILETPILANHSSNSNIVVFGDDHPSEDVLNLISQTISEIKHRASPPSQEIIAIPSGDRISQEITHPVESTPTTQVPHTEEAAHCEAPLKKIRTDETAAPRRSTRIRKQIKY